MWPLKIVSRDSLFPLTSKDFSITINDTTYVNTLIKNIIKICTRNIIKVGNYIMYNNNM